MERIDLPGFPERFTANGDWEFREGVLQGRAAARTDHFLHPTGEEGLLNSATLLTEVPAGDFVFSTQVEVDFEAPFDAGTLFLHFDDAHWAKLCFEATPEVRPSVVSVVTRGLSDDANAFYPESNRLHLRISRIGQAYVFHASPGGAEWNFVRYFHLGPEGKSPRVGFGAQSPAGEGCSVRFTGMRLEQRTLAEMRDGS